MKYRHLHISELKAGMKVVDPGLNWLAHPYLYMKDQVIRSEQEVREIAQEGYLEVYVEEGSVDAFPKQGVPDAEDLKTPLPENLSQQLKPRVALKEELTMACKVHDESVAFVRNFMNDAKAGKLDMAPASRIIEGITESIGRNADALVTISRLRRTDSYTYMHCVNVSMLTAMLARHVGHGADEVFLYGLAGIFHDLGKSRVPNEILNAPRKLSERERKVMDAHPRQGFEMLSKVQGIRDEILYGALHHHEKQNGSGYPEGLADSHITTAGSMVAIADVYDALTSRRVYKEAMYASRALGIMYKMQGGELHTGLLLRFIRMLGVYPVGSVVQMRDGCLGVVSASNPDFPVRPEVTLVRDDKGKPMPPEVHDLSHPEAGMEIVKSIPAGETDIDPAVVLGFA